MYIGSGYGYQNPSEKFLGKSELWQNLYTTDLAEANRKKHRVVAELMDVIEQAKRDLDGTLDTVSREERLKEFALEFTRESDATNNNDDEDVEDFLKRLLKQKYTNYMEIKRVKQ